MFTGIISEVGEVASVRDHGGERELQIVARTYNDVALGESIATNGVCLTVASRNDQRLTFFVSSETLSRSNLGSLEPGSTVNLERALRLSDRLSGHLVQGHVDGRAKLASVRAVGGSHALEIHVPSELQRYIVEKGSIALDGISLTVNSVKNSTLSLTIVPHTWENTALKTKRIGQDFNVEVDMVAKYLEKLTRHS